MIKDSGKETGPTKDAGDVSKESVEDESKEKATKDEEILVQPSKLNLKVLKLLSKKETPNKEVRMSVVHHK